MAALVTFGRTALELSSPPDAQLEITPEFRGYAAGSASNVAVATHRNGASATWISKLPDSPLGRRTVHQLAGHGIHTAIVWSEESRHGIAFTERAGAPRGDQAVSDRERAAITTMTPEELPKSLVREASMVYVNAVTPTASAALAETTGVLFETAVEAGATTVLGLGIGSTPAIRADAPTDLFERTDVLVTRPSAAEATLSRDTQRTPVELAHTLAARHGFETVVLARSHQPAVAWHDTTIHEQPRPETHTVDPRGAADALAGGFLARRVAGESIPDALAAGVATSSLARTVPGPLVTLGREEIDRVRGEIGQ